MKQVKWREVVRRVSECLVPPILGLFIGCLMGLILSENLMRSQMVVPEKVVHKEITIIKSEKFVVTGYCLNEYHMANGQHVFSGAAACPRRIKLGTKIKIGNKEYICTDRLALQYDSRIDIWFASCSSAINFGKKRLAVQFIK